MPFILWTQNQKWVQTGLVQVKACAALSHIEELFYFLFDFQLKAIKTEEKIVN